MASICLKVLMRAETEKCMFFSVLELLPLLCEDFPSLIIRIFRVLLWKSYIKTMQYEFCVVMMNTLNTFRFRSMNI